MRRPDPRVLPRAKDPCWKGGSRRQRGDERPCSALANGGPKRDGKRSTTSGTNMPLPARLTRALFCRDGGGALFIIGIGFFPSMTQLCAGAEWARAGPNAHSWRQQTCPLLISIYMEHRKRGFSRTAPRPHARSNWRTSLLLLLLLDAYLQRAATYELPRAVRPAQACVGSADSARLRARERLSQRRREQPTTSR